VTRIAARLVFSPFARVRIWLAPGARQPIGAAVLVSNHISHFDPILLSFLIRRPIDWMTTEEFYDNPLLGAWLRGLNTFPVDRSRPDRRALRVGMERLRAGRLIGVFPEGGIRAGPTSIFGGASPKSGATALARLAAAPIVPCMIFGADRLYATRSWRPGPPRAPVWMALGPPFPVANADETAANERLGQAMRDLGAAMVEHFHLAPEDLPATPQHRKGRDRAPNEQT
jgi:1-acyl-sn-glycerol-3-phosphate acyltransferase